MLQMGFFAEAGPLQVFVSSHVSALDQRLSKARVFCAAAMSPSWKLLVAA